MKNFRVKCMFPGIKHTTEHIVERHVILPK